MAVTPPVTPAPSAVSKLGRVAALIARTVAFLRSPQGKRDIALVVAAGSALADLVHQLGV